MGGRDLSGPVALLVIICIIAIIMQWLFSRTAGASSDISPGNGRVVWEKGMPLP